MIDNYFEIIKGKIYEFSRENNWFDQHVTVTAPLEITDAIGHPDRYDYPLYKGKEFLVEADFLGCRGQAFTKIPKKFEGTVNEVLSLDPVYEENSAIIIALFNAMMRKAGMIEGSIHCKNTSLKQCSDKLTEYLEKNHKTAVKVGLIGLQPGFLASLSKKFGAENLLCSDKSLDNCGKIIEGVQILDGSEYKHLIEQSDVILCTGSVFVNHSGNEILEYCRKNSKPVIFFGVSGIGISRIKELEHYCPLCT